MKKIRLIFLLAATAFCAAALNSCTGSTAQDEGRAKYIFVMIGDGTGENQITATESYLSWKAGNLGAERLTCTNFPVLGFCTTYSATHNITDSAAGGTAIATGAKTYNYAIGVDENGEPLKSMAYTLKEEGYKVGILTSVPVNHATPAAFFAHQPDRNMYYEIGLELPGSQFDFFAGSGILESDGKDHDQKPLEEIYEENGYRLYYGLDEFRDADKDGSGVVLVQPSAKETVLNYDVIHEEILQDRLGEVLSTAIDCLGDEQPFFIMCEGGEIDWGGHDNNIMATVDAVVRFDEAIKVAYDFYLEHPDETLIVVTADHETGGLALGAGKGSRIDWEGLEQEYADRSASHTQAENREISYRHNIGWTTSGHTGTPVPVYAIGKGASKFAGRIDNTEIYGKLVCE